MSKNSRTVKAGISKPAGDQKHSEKEKKGQKSRRQQPSGAHARTRSLALTIKMLNAEGRWMSKQSRAEDAGFKEGG